MLHTLRMSILLLALKQTVYLPKGNGVVIHLPGLFEEAEKNEKKGLCHFFMLAASMKGFVSLGLFSAVTF